MSLCTCLSDQLPAVLPVQRAADGKQLCSSGTAFALPGVELSLCLCNSLKAQGLSEQLLHGTAMLSFVPYPCLKAVLR